MALRTAPAAVAIALTLSMSSVAHADGPGTPTSPPDDPPPAPTVGATVRPRAVHEHEAETEWYGWQILVADGTSLLVVPAAAAASQSSGLGIAAVAGYFLAPPIIHAAHGRWGFSFASLGLRVALPLIGGLIGAAADDCKGELCIPVAAALGVGIGVLGAAALDASLLSYDTIETDPRPAARRAAPTKIMWAPTIAPRKEGGLTLGLGATF